MSELITPVICVIGDGQRVQINQHEENAIKRGLKGVTKGGLILIRYKSRILYCFPIVLFFFIVCIVILKLIQTYFCMCVLLLISRILSVLFVSKQHQIGYYRARCDIVCLATNAFVILYLSCN